MNYIATISVIKVCKTMPSLKYVCENVLPQMGCWRFSRCPPQGYLLTSQAQTQNSLGSGQRSLCHSPGKICFPLACIPCACGMDIQHDVLLSFCPAVTKWPPDVSNARWLLLQSWEDAKPHIKPTCKYMVQFGEQLPSRLPGIPQDWSH